MIGYSHRAQRQLREMLLHYEKLDRIEAVKPPFQPEEVTQRLADILSSYGLSEVTGDRYGAQWVSSMFRKFGISYRASDLDKSAIYIESLPLFTQRIVELLDVPVALLQKASEEDEALFRELRLMKERSEADPSLLPERLTALLSEIGTRFSGLGPGVYEIAVIAVQGGATARRSLAITLE